jgi:hypothetical protein
METDGHGAETLRFIELLGRTRQPIWMNTQYFPGKSFAIVVEIAHEDPAVVPLIRPTPSFVVAQSDLLYATWLLSETSQAHDSKWMPQVAFDLAEHVGGTAFPYMLIPGVMVPETTDLPTREGYARLIEIGDCRIYDPAELAKLVALGNQR